MVFFISIQILFEHPVSKQWKPDQTPRFAVSGLGLYCLPVPYKKDAWLKWVNKEQMELGHFQFIDKAIK